MKIILSGARMLTIEQIRESLQDRNLTKVSDATGVSKATIYRICSGAENPSYDAVKKLSDYIEKSCEKSKP